MGRIEPLCTFFGQALIQVFSADTIDTVPSEFFRLLVDEQPVPVCRFRPGAILIDIKLDEFGGSFRQLYLAEAIPLPRMARVWFW